MAVKVGGGEGGEENYAEEFIVDGGGRTLSTWRIQKLLLTTPGFLYGS